MRVKYFRLLNHPSGSVLFLVFALWLSTRLYFYLYSFDVQTFLVNMPGGIDKRALAIVNGKSVVLVNAWGPFSFILGQFYRLLNFFGWLEWRAHFVFWLHQFSVFLTALVFLRTIGKSDLKVGWLTLLPMSLFVLDPLLLLHASMPLSEPLFILALSISLFYLINIKQISNREFVLLAIALSLTLVLRNMALALVLVAAFAMARTKNIDWKTKLSALGLFLAIYMSTGWFSTSFEKTSHAELNQNRIVNLLQTWCEAKFLRYRNTQHQFWFSPPDFWPMPISTSIYTNQEFGNSSHYLPLIVGCISEHPLRIVERLHAIRNTFIGPIYPDPLAWSQREEKFISLTFFSALLLVAAIFGFTFKKSDFFFWPTLAFLSLNLAVVLGSPGEMRFRLSLWPALLLLGVSAIQRIKNNPRLIAVFLLSLPIAQVNLRLWKSPWKSHVQAEQVAMETKPPEELIETLKQRLEWALAYPYQEPKEICQSPADYLKVFCQTWKATQGLEDFTLEAETNPKAEAKLKLKNLVSVSSELLTALELNQRHPEEPRFAQPVVRKMIAKLLEFQTARNEIEKTVPRFGRISLRHDKQVFTDVSQGLFIFALKRALSSFEAKTVD